METKSQIYGEKAEKRQKGLFDFCHLLFAIWLFCDSTFGEKKDLNDGVFLNSESNILNSESGAAEDFRC